MPSTPLEKLLDLKHVSQTVIVTPAKARVQGDRWGTASVDSRFRGNDEISRFL